MNLLHRWRSYFRFQSFSWPRIDGRKKTTIPRQGSEFQSEPVFWWPIYNDVDEPHVHRISTQQEPTVLTNFYIRAIIIPYLVSYLVDRHGVCDWSTASRIGALGNRSFAVGSDGRRWHWLNIWDVHHGLLEIIPWREGVWEEREMELRADWEWDELVYHNYWVKVRQLGHHERIDGGSHDGGGPIVGGVDGDSLIWGDGTVLVLTIGGWSSFRRPFSDLSRGWELSRWGGTHLLIAVSTLNIVRGEVLTCSMKSRMETLRVVDGLLVMLQRSIELNLSIASGFPK